MWIKRITAPASDLGPAEIVLRLTAVIVLLRPMGPWGVRPLPVVLAGLAIALPVSFARRRRGMPWPGSFQQGSSPTGRCRTIMSTCSRTGAWRSRSRWEPKMAKPSSIGAAACLSALPS